MYKTYLPAKYDYQGILAVNSQMVKGVFLLLWHQVKRKKTHTTPYWISITVFFLIMMLLMAFSAKASGPTVSSTTPNDNATNVDPTEDIIIHFDQNIKDGILTGDYLEIYKSGTFIASYNSDDFNEGILLFSDKVIINNDDDGGAYQALPEITAGLFEPGASYTIVVSSGFVRSDDGMNTNNAQHVFSFTTASIPDDGQPPSPTVFFPDNVTSFSPSQNLKVTFSEAIQKGDGVVRLYQRDYGNVSTSTADDTNTLLQELDISSSAITIENNNTLVIDFPLDLPSNSNSLGGSAGATLFIFIQSTASGFAAVEDLQGNGMSFNFPTGTTTDPVWKFNTSSDNTSPAIISQTPADDATGVDITSNLSFTMNEVIRKNVGNVLVRRSSDDVIIQSIDINAVTLSNSSTLPKTVTVLLSDLEYGTDYYVQIDNEALRDGAFNFFEGINNTTSWNFTTEVAADLIAPTLTGSTPADNAVDVALATNITLDFSENVVLADASNVQLRRLDNDAEVSATKSVISSTLTINPTANLDEGTFYYVFIGTEAITDAADNDFAGLTASTSLNFTTLDNTAPVIASRTPNDDATDVAVDADIVITFNESVVLANATNVQLRRSDNSEVASSKSVSGATLTLNPESDLSHSTSYHVHIATGAIEDLAGNDFTGITTTTDYNFTTAAPADNTSPEPTSYFPVQDAIGVVLG